MTALAGILAVTFPFFALVLCGYVAARSRVLPLDSVPGLNMFVLYFALPCMLYRFGSTTPAAQLFDPGVALLWIVCAALLIWLAAGAARRRGAGWPDAAMGALVAVFPNSGFMGVPLIVALLGESGAGPVMASLLVDLVLTSSLCIGLSQWHDVGTARLPGESPVLLAVARALRGAVANPLPWSILLGALAGAVGFALWEPLDQTVALLADAASPMALFTIGAVLARAQLQPGSQGAAPVTLNDVGFVTALKLVAHPVLLVGLGALAVWVRLLPAPLLVPLVLTAALPSASSVSLLAERFGADNGRIARIILWSTALAFFSFSGVVAVVT